jgi:hypothetical protein
VSSRSGTYAVDRLQGRLATLIAGDGTVADIPLRWLPSGLREGTVIKVAIGARGPDWGTAQSDEAASSWRDALIGLILEQLRWRRMGGALASCVSSGFTDSL